MRDQAGYRRSGLVAAVAAGLAALAGAPAAAEPAAPPSAGSAAFDPATKVDGPLLQVIFGERGLIRLSADGRPTLEGREKGQLAIAHPPGAVSETFRPPPKGQIAVALDGSAEKRASYLKIWNGLGHPIAYHAAILVLHQGRLIPVKAKVCAVPAGGTNYETWPEPVVAVALSGFTPAADDKACAE